MLTASPATSVYATIISGLGYWASLLTGTSGSHCPFSAQEHAWITHHITPLLKTCRWLPITLGNKNKSQSLSMYELAPGSPTDAFLPLTPFSPLRSHCSPLNMSSILVTQGLCTSCPCCLGTFSVPYFFTSFGSQLFREAFPTTPLKLSSLTHLSLTPSPTSLIFIVHTIPWHSMVLVCLFVAVSLQWNISSKKGGLWVTAEPPVSSSVSGPQHRWRAQVLELDGPSLKLSSPPTSCEISDKALYPLHLYSGHNSRHVGIRLLLFGLSWLIFVKCFKQCWMHNTSVAIFC